MSAVIAEIGPVCHHRCKRQCPRNRRAEYRTGELPEGIIATPTPEANGLYIECTAHLYDPEEVSDAVRW